MISITFANLTDGLNLMSLFDDAFAQCMTLSDPITVTAAGVYTISPTQTGDILIDKTVPAANDVQLPPASMRDNQPVSVIDVAGNASIYNITILPYGSELIMGQASIVISGDYGGYTFYPIPTGGWYMK